MWRACLALMRWVLFLFHRLWVLVAALQVALPSCPGAPRPSAELS